MYNRRQKSPFDSVENFKQIEVTHKLQHSFVREEINRETSKKRGKTSKITWIHRHETKQKLFCSINLQFGNSSRFSVRCGLNRIANRIECITNVSDFLNHFGIMPMRCVIMTTNFLPPSQHQVQKVNRTKRNQPKTHKLNLETFLFNMREKHSAILLFQFRK